MTPRLHSWPAPLQALALMMNLRLGLQHMQSKFVYQFTSLDYYEPVED